MPRSTMSAGGAGGDGTDRAARARRRASATADVGVLRDARAALAAREGGGVTPSAGARRDGGEAKRGTATGRHTVTFPAHVPATTTSEKPYQSFLHETPKPHHRGTLRSGIHTKKMYAKTPG